MIKARIVLILGIWAILQHAWCTQLAEAFCQVGCICDCSCISPLRGRTATATTACRPVSRHALTVKSAGVLDAHQHTGSLTGQGCIMFHVCSWYSSPEITYALLAAAVADLVIIRQRSRFGSAVPVPYSTVALVACHLLLRMEICLPLISSAAYRHLLPATKHRCKAT
jgi:hypothetical protein